MLMLLAQAGTTLSLMHLLIIVIVILAAVGIAMVAIRSSGISIPPALVTIGWIVVIAVVAIVAIKILMGFV